MAEFYNAEKLLEFVKQNTPHIDGETTMQCVERAIKEAPTADVVEVKHGEWQLKECQCGLFSITDFFVCSACKEEFDVDGWDYEDLCANAKYCPNCGAKMDGGKANGR